MNLYSKQKQTHRETKLMITKGIGNGEGQNINRNMGLTDTNCIPKQKAWREFAKVQKIIFNNL